MKKMNKSYEAPVAEMIEIEKTNVFLNTSGTGNVGGDGSGNSPWLKSNPIP